MGKFRTSFELVKMSFKIINKEKELLVYTLLSGIASVLVILSFIFGVIGVGIFSGTSLHSTNQTTQGITEFLFYFLFYFVLTFVALFFNTAIITSVNRVLKGEENSFMDGISDAFKNIGKIFMWTVVTAFVSTILKIIQDRVPMVAKIVVSLVGVAWNIATIFAFPLMILGNRKISVAIKESPKLFIKTWGENVIMNVGVGFFFMIVFFGILFGMGTLTIFAFTLGPEVGLIMGVIMVISFVLCILLSITMDSVVRIVLYNYTQTGIMPSEVNKENLEDMFKKTK